MMQLFKNFGSIKRYLISIITQVVDLVDNGAQLLHMMDIIANLVGLQEIVAEVVDMTDIVVNQVNSPVE